MNETHENNLPIMDLIKPDPGAAYFRLKPSFNRAPLLVLLILLLFLSLYIFLRAVPLFEHFEMLKNSESNDAIKIKNYGDQLQSLQNKMTGFIAESLEVRLARLEKNVASGSVGPDEIRTFEELKAQLKLLENYSGGKDGNLIDSAKLEHSRYQALNPLPQENSKFHELMRLKNLFYISIASSGFAMVMIGGYWWRSHQREKQLALSINRLALTLNK